jgi:DNA (cytosine-5)-methyltransferase 1
MIPLLTIGTDCSGIEAPLQALIQLKIPFKQKWSCDIDKFARESAVANYPEPSKIYNDINSRNHSELPHVDIYVCGFPCQSFSMAGKRLGTADFRASVIISMITTIKSSKPKIIILENVCGFKSIENGKPYSELIEILGKEYNINTSIYNTKDYGLPQNRKRIYFVGIRKDIQKKEFIKPKEVKMKLLTSIVDSSLKGEKTPLKLDFLKKIRLNKDATYNIINMGFIRGNKTPIASSDFSPTLLTSEPPVIYELNRTFTIKELLQLQGFPKNFKVVVSNTQIIKQIGNSMSVCVIKQIIKEALKCI